ncbi:MAG: peptidyl-prolyl cis-trans isomerase [Alphaproteobacteria bacterium]|nr:peptidyl-prolyl cis-trans isomerase [Alphaproteobacteria bacterium]
MKIKSNLATIVLSLFVAESLYAGALSKDFKNKESDAVEQSSDMNSITSSDTEAAKKDNNATETSKNNNSTTVTPKKEIKGDPVVAKIGRSKEFRRSDVLKVVKTLPAQMTQGMSEDKLFSMCLDQLVASYLMVEQAKKAGMDKSKDFTERLDNVKNDLLARTFLMKEVAPKAENESALKARYTKYLVEFKKMIETEIFHIMLSSEDDAKAIIARLDKGEDFGKIAKEKSLAPSKDKNGEEGYIVIDVLPSSIKDKLSSLKKGEYTKEALKTDNGYHIFKVGNSRDTSPQKFDEVKDGLKQLIVQEEIVKLVDRLVKQFNVVRFNEDGSPITEKKVEPISAQPIADSTAK